MAAPGNNWEYYKKRITEILKSDEWELVDQNEKPYKMDELKPALASLPLGHLYSIFKLRLKTKNLFGGVGSFYYADVSVWTLSSIPAQCGMLLSSRSCIYNHNRMGLGTLMNQLRQDIARNLGYTTLLCTNKKEQSEGINQRLLQKLGWKNVYEFRNDRTKNLISVNIVQLID